MGEVTLSSASGRVKCSWGCRHVSRMELRGDYSLLSESRPPGVGDVAVVAVEEIGYHHHLDTADARRFRIYEGDHLLCVFGNRYATDVYEGKVLALDDNRLHLLSRSGVIGTVVSRNRDVKEPTTLSLRGYLGDSSGNRINLIDLAKPRKHRSYRPNAGIDVVLVVGTGMNTGKTTVTRRVLRELVQRGQKVAGCKLTGTTSPRDLQEMHSTGALVATDFSDYGFPSTYGATLPDLILLFNRMLDACGRAKSDVVIMEIADGILQRETEMLLGDEEFRRRVRGVIVTAPCAASALYAASRLETAGLEVWAVSGIITNSPLFVQEFSGRSSVPVASSRTGKTLADLVVDRLAVHAPKNPPKAIASSDMSAA